MKVTCVSDLHGEYPDLEGGDLLIVAGDLTAADTQNQHMEFLSWISAQPYRKKIWIAGNHDNYLIGTKFIPIKDLGLEYLCDSGTEFEGLKIWGSPWTKNFTGQNPKCKAFGLDLDVQMMEKWQLIPPDTDILITHTPPFGVLDRSNRHSRRFGCPKLADKLINMHGLELHVFGHIHGGYGNQHQAYYGMSPWDENPTPMGHLSVNASIMDEDYEPVNKPITIEL